MASPFKWQRSSAACRLRNGGRQSGVKLERSEIVAMQPNPVARNNGRPVPSIATS